MKKNSFKYIGVISSLFCMLLLSSCLKDKNGLTNYTDAGTPVDIIEFREPDFHALAFELSDTPDTAKAYVRVTAPQVLDHDVTVTISLDTAGLTAYNEANDAAYELLDPTAYTIPSFTVTIPAGQRTGFLPVIINSRKVDLAKANAIPLKITDASGKLISRNAQTVIYAIVVKNEYDADYHAVGYFEHPTAPREIDREKHLATINANTVETELGDLGSATMQLTVNADNTITFKPTGTSNPTAALISGDAVYNNTYDPQTKTFKLKYGYPNPGPTRIITEILTRE